MVRGGGGGVTGGEGGGGGVHGRVNIALYTSCRLSNPIIINITSLTGK